MPVKKGDPSPRKGIPNKATTDARLAIAKFVDGNAHRLQQWLDKIANGTPRLDADGHQVRDPETGELLFEVRPNPAQAFTLFQTVIEYHVPKLQRSEQVGPGGGPVQHEHKVSAAGAVADAILKRLG